MRDRAAREQVQWLRAICLMVQLVLCPARLSAADARSSPPPSESVSVVTPGNTDKVLRFAGAELARYIERIQGSKVLVGDLEASHRIYVGKIPSHIPPAAAQKLRADLSAIKKDGFIVRRIGPDVIIVGNGARGNLFGSYAFLERLGARWYFPGRSHEVVPRRRIDWRGPLEIVESPAVPERVLSFDGDNYTPLEDWIDFAAKVRVNRFAFFQTSPPMQDWYVYARPRLLLECEKRGLMIETGSHLLSSFLPRNLFREHPDWFRMNEQGQRANDYNFNPFSTAALGYVARGVVDHLSRTPEAVLFHVWPDDIFGGGWSHEPGKEQYTPSDQSLLAANEIVRRLHETLPMAKLAFLAYHDTVFPPRMVKPEPGIVYFYAPRERCYAHSLSDPECGLNKRYRSALEEALPAFGPGNAEAFEYYVDEILFMNLTCPPLPDVIKRDVAYYRQLGIPAVAGLVVSQGEYVTPAVNAFLYPQALWNPQRDLNESLKEYALIYFGDAGLAVYFNELAEGLRNVLQTCEYTNPGDSWEFSRVEKESDMAFAHHVENMELGLRGPLASAQSVLGACQPKSRVYEARLQRERASLGFTLLQARLFYHLHKGELNYRLYRRRGDNEAGLRVASEAVLARYTYERLKRYIGRGGLKGFQLVPDPSSLEGRSRELVREGYYVQSIYERLRDGVFGYIVADSSESRAMLTTDLEPVRWAIHPEVPGLEWQDEFGQPLRVRNLNSTTSPVMVVGRGMTPRQLFNKLMENQEMK